MREVALVIWHPPRAITGILDDDPGPFALGRREILPHHRGILRMQMHAHLARCDRQRRNRFADDADDLRRIRLQLAPHDLARKRHRERQQFTLHFGIELLERLGEVVEHAGELLDLRPHLPAARLAAFGKSLLEGFPVSLGLQIGEAADGGHWRDRRGAADVGCRPHFGVAPLLLW